MSPEEAEADLVEKLKPAPLASASSSFDAFVQDVWWPRVELKCSPLTKRRYKSIYELHIKFQIGSTPLDRLTATDCQNVVIAAAKAVGPTSTWHIAHQLKRILQLAVDLDMLDRNPARRVEIPRRPAKREKSLTVAQAQALMEHVAGTPVEAPVVICMFLGLRRGEVCGLKWDDLDRQARTLSVVRQVQYPKGDIKGVIIREPKTAGSRRTLYLTQGLVDLIDSIGNLDSVWICGKGTEPMNPERLSKYWIAHRQKWGFADWTLHDLRHAAASLLNYLGVPLPTIASILGHSSVDMSLWYTSVSQKGQAEAFGKVDEHLRSVVNVLSKPKN